MTEKRYYAHKHLLQENKVHDKRCHNFMNIDETVEHMNNEYWKYKQLKEENEQLKTQIRIFEEFLKYNNLDIYWGYFCAVDECPVTDEDEISCKECKYLRWLE